MIHIFWFRALFDWFSLVFGIFTLIFMVLKRFIHIWPIFYHFITFCLNITGFTSFWLVLKGFYLFGALFIEIEGQHLFGHLFYVQGLFYNKIHTFYNFLSKTTFLDVQELITLYFTWFTLVLQLQHLIFEVSYHSTIFRFRNWYSTYLANI